MKKSRFVEPAPNLPIFPETNDPNDPSEPNQTQPGRVSNGRPDVMDFDDRSDTEDISDPENVPIPSNPGISNGVNETPNSPVSNFSHGHPNSTDSDMGATTFWAPQM